MCWTVAKHNATEENLRRRQKLQCTEWKKKRNWFHCVCVCVCVFLFRAIPVAYGGSQARGQIRAVAASLQPQPQQCGIRATSTTCTTAHGNTGSLTHWASPGIEPASSWMLVGFVSAEPWQELPLYIFFKRWSTEDLGGQWHHSVWWCMMIKTCYGTFVKTQRMCKTKTES